MIPKSGNRFSDKIMPRQKAIMSPKSRNRFLGKVMPPDKRPDGRYIVSET
jgi:hypothetical protein